MEPLLTDILNGAVRKNVTVYAIDSRGVNSPLFPAGGASEPGRNQSAVAFRNGANDVLRELQTVVADGRESYMLSYVPANGQQESKFRKITVETRDTSVRLGAKAGCRAN